MAGAGYKLFNTGDVLTAAQVNTYLMEQTVMVFADAAARTTALTGVVSEGMISYLKDTNAVEVYNGSAWVSSDDPNAIQNTIVDAKGDLITATASDVPARLAVGNNGETLVADSSTSTGLRYQTGYNANAIINGGFDIWQRGTSFTANTGYTADRWYKSGVAGRTYTRQTTSDTTNLPTIQYCLRASRDSGNTATDNIVLSSSLESTDAQKFVGQTVTLSFYARKGANFSPTSSNIIARLYSGTGTDQNVEVSYTGSSAVINQSAVLTTTWQRFQYTATVGTTATELAVWFAAVPTGTAGAADYFEITGVQLELGSVATTFKRAKGGTLAGELAACQRYYYRWTPVSAGIFGVGFSDTTTSALVNHFFPVVMRTAPTALEQSGTASDYTVRRQGGSVIACNSVPTFGATSTIAANIQLPVASGLTAGEGSAGRAANTSAYLGWSAEL
jgi:hypothetical protein